MIVTVIDLSHGLEGVLARCGIGIDAYQGVFDFYNRAFPN